MSTYHTPRLVTVSLHSHTPRGPAPFLWLIMPIFFDLSPACSKAMSKNARRTTFLQYSELSLSIPLVDDVLVPRKEHCVHEVFRLTSRCGSLVSLCLQLRRLCRTSDSDD